LARAGSEISSAGSAGAPGTSKSGLRVFSTCSGSVVVPAGSVVEAAGAVVVAVVVVSSVVAAAFVVSAVVVASVDVSTWSRVQSLTRTTRVPL
jgi:hypothetical protein